MRTFTLIGVTCGVPFGFAAATSTRHPSLVRAEAAQDRGFYNWEGRRHYLNNEEYRPESDGSAPVIKGWSKKRVRVRRSDGMTTIKSINECE